MTEETKPKHPGGRPSKYNEDTVPQTQFYLDNWEDMGQQIPTIAGLAVHLHVARETIHAWARDEEKEEFSHIYRELMAIQELTLGNKGLSGDFNSTITKLILTKHGYSDKVEQEIGGPNGGAVQIQYVINPVRPVQPEEGGSDG